MNVFARYLSALDRAPWTAFLPFAGRITRGSIDRTPTHGGICSILLFLMVILSGSSVRADITTGLVGWWKLDDRSGVIARDSSGLGNDLTTNSSWVAGRVGGAGYFLDGSQYAYKSSPVGLPSAAQARTFSAWFKLANTSFGPPGVELVGLGSNGGTGKRFALSLDSSGSCAGTAAGIEILNAGVMFLWTPDKNWHHLVATYSSGNINTAKIYMDKVLQTPCVASSATLNTDSSEFIINGIPTAGGMAAYGMTGVIDDVRIYNRALTAQDVYELYHSSYVRLRGAHLRGFKVQ